MIIRKHIYIIIYIIFLLTSHNGFAQDYSTIYGRVLNTNEESIFLATISIQGKSIGTSTNNNGYYELKVPSDTLISLVFSCLGYKTEIIKYNCEIGKKYELNINLEASTEKLTEVEIKAVTDENINLTKIDIRNLDILPDLSGNIESLLKTMPGVASTNELSSQYSVRGGNFDENLVYVNNIEIYRPFLIRAGQQEGLSFINSDLVSSIRFSGGGFETMYGDKMSSVLDIKYKDPSEFMASANISMLGGSAHIQDISENKKFSHISGFRYKTNQYILKSLETKGEYHPSFWDFQTFWTYAINNTIKINFLGNYSQNKYRFKPETRKTSFGTLNNALDLRIYYEGQEVDRFETYLGALSVAIQPKQNLRLNFVTSAFSTIEDETYDILGQYYINELDNSQDSENLGDSIMNIGIGSFLNHARNYLNAHVISSYFNGLLSKPKNKLRWGLKFQREIISDNLNQWKMIDSAGYSVPYSDSLVFLSESLNTSSRLSTNRITSFFQNTFNILIDSTRINITAGIRTNFWSLNNQFLVSPRIIITYIPEWQKDISFHFASGFYYQPPFYKELRAPDGELNKNIQAQKSIHFVLGGNYNFLLWGRPFKLTTEIYYKKYDNLIPYKIDNVRIQYSAKNNAIGYATGIDMKIFGEFVDGIDSWASLSIMKTEEDISNDFYFNSSGERIEPEYYPRPTDQRVNFNLFFQDYIPNNPSYKVHLNLIYGGKLPFSSPYSERFDNPFRMPAYRRVDIGFSKLLIPKTNKSNNQNSVFFAKNVWISAEIFNLLDINNTISYIWISTISSDPNSSIQYAVPNYLTSRRFNFKLSARF